MIWLILAGFGAGFVDAIAGGGGLISLPALLAMGLPPATALGTNKAIGIATALASTVRYGSARTIQFRELGPLAFFVVATAFAGAWSATQLSPEILRPVILVGLVSVGLYTIVRRDFGGGSTGTRRFAPLCIASLLLGFYDGFFGPGTGTFLMMALVLLGNLPLLEASASARFINLASNLGALILFSSKGYTEYWFVLPGAIAALVGGLLGASLALHKGARVIRPVFIAITWALIVKVGWDFLS